LKWRKVKLREVEEEEEALVGLNVVDLLRRHRSKSTASLISQNSCQEKSKNLVEEVVLSRLGKYIARIFEVVLQDRYKVDADLASQNYML
jgi:hypothetical protein